MKIIQDGTTNDFYPVFEPGDKVKIRWRDKDSKHKRFVNATVLYAERNESNYFGDRSGGGVSYTIKVRNMEIHGIWGCYIQYIYKRTRRLDRNEI